MMWGIEDKGRYSCRIQSLKYTSLLGEGVPDQKYLYLQARGCLKSWCCFPAKLSAEILQTTCTDMPVMFMELS
jgi:hypothetical protein